MVDTVINEWQLIQVLITTGWEPPEMKDWSLAPDWADFAICARHSNGKFFWVGSRIRPKLEFKDKWHLNYPGDIDDAIIGWPATSRDHLKIVHRKGGMIMKICKSCAPKTYHWAFTGLAMGICQKCGTAADVVELPVHTVKGEK